MNPEVATTLDDAVAEVLGLLVGTDLSYRPELDRYRSITRQLNRALRAVAVEHEWSYYSDTESVGFAHQGDRAIALRASVRPRIISDDSIRLVRPSTGAIVRWAYFLPRESLHKYRGSRDLYAAYTRQMLEFSRPFNSAEDGLDIQLPVMREPKMFRLPKQPEDVNEPLVTVPDEIREQLIDFDYPDLIVRKAAYFYAQTDPVMQPRVQTLDQDYKDMMYGLIERDSRNTDSPYINEWDLGISGSIEGDTYPHGFHPHAGFAEGFRRG